VRWTAGDPFSLNRFNTPRRINNPSKNQKREGGQVLFFAYPIKAAKGHAEEVEFKGREASLALQPFQSRKVAYPALKPS